MRKFEFRLEKVLQFREIVKSEKRKELLLQNNRLHQAEGNLESLRQAQLNNQLEAGAVRDDRDLLLVGNYAGRLKQMIGEQLDEIAMVEQYVEKAREEYIDASKEAEALKLLKDKRFGQYKKEVAKEEEAIVDELVVQRQSMKKRKLKVNQNSSD